MSQRQRQRDQNVKQERKIKLRLNDISGLTAESDPRPEPVKSSANVRPTKTNTGNKTI